MNKKVISFSVYINLGELQNCPAFLMHKQDNSSLSPTPNRKEEKKMVKLTPPMGWNSWNTFGEKINESLIKETADYMAASGLKDAGYDYLVIDDCWSLKERDAQGRLVADPAKFPNGMKAVADYVHSKGLKFGMYSCAGNLTCVGYPGSYEHEFTDAETFASWGVDFLKYDYCYHSPIVAGKYLYRRMGLALENCGRDILFSACSWGADETHEWMKESGASMWRSTGDIFDTWESVKDLVHQQEKLLPYNATGCFNDMDMLIVGMYGQGNVGLKGCNDTQYKTHYSIWALLGSPLMIGCDIRNMNDATRNILMNRDLIAINQDAMCRQAVKLNGIWAGEDMVMYSRNLSNGDIAIGLFNLSENKSAARFNLDELGLPQSTGHTLEMTEVWTKKNSTVTNGTWIQELDAYDCAVYRAKVVKA
jgi:alpha-galactosidase